MSAFVNDASSKWVHL